MGDGVIEDMIKDVDNFSARHNLDPVETERVRAKLIHIHKSLQIKTDR